MPILRAPYKSGTVYVDGIEITIDGFLTQDLDERKANRLLASGSGYMVYQGEVLGEDGQKNIKEHYVPPVVKKRFVPSDIIIDKHSKAVLATFENGELGDRYMFAAVLRAFKMTHPTIELDLILYPSERDSGGYRGLFENNRYINNVYMVDDGKELQGKRYKKFYELGAVMASHIEYKSRNTPRNRMEIWCEVLGVDLNILRDSIRGEPVIDCTNEEIKFVDTKITSMKSNGRMLVGIAPFSSNPYKEWPTWRWQLLVDTLVKKHDCVCCTLHAKSTGSTEMLHDLNEASFNNTFLFSDLDYRMLSLFIRHLDVLIGAEAAHTNIAGLVGTPFITFTGPQSGKSYTKYYSNKIVLERHWDCMPCWYPFGVTNIDPTTYFATECAHLKHAACIHDIKMEEVLENFEHLMKIKEK